MKQNFTNDQIAGESKLSFAIKLVLIFAAIAAAAAIYVSFIPREYLHA